MSETISRAQGVELVQNFTAATIDRDVDRLMSFYHRDAIVVSPVFGEVIGRNAIAASWQRFFSTLHDIRIHVSDVLVDGSQIAMTGRVLATTGPEGWFGVAAHGSAVDYRLVLLLTVGEGKIRRDERIYDRADLLERFQVTRRDEEIRLAEEVQHALLPRTAMSAPFCNSVGRAVPCRAIGGDFFDFVDLPSGDIGIVIGDVAGKGAPASLLAALIQGMLSVEALTEAGPASVLSRINSRLSTRHVRSSFAKLVYCVVSANGQLTYCNAGHNPPAVLSRGRVRRLTTGGPMLGALPQARFAEESIKVDSGDVLIMFTDGISEAVNVDGDEFGDERLISQFVDISCGAGELLDSVFESVQSFCAGTEQNDDLTATVTQFA